jgi:hypothetical protein
MGSILSVEALCWSRFTMEKKLTRFRHDRSINCSDVQSHLTSLIKNTLLISILYYLPELVGDSIYIQSRVRFLW